MKRRKQHHWSKREVKELKHLIRMGYPNRKIAKQMNIDTKVIADKIYNSGLTHGQGFYKRTKLHGLRISQGLSKSKRMKKADKNKESEYVEIMEW
jgi:hypothetical protein